MQGPPGGNKQRGRHGTLVEPIDKIREQFGGASPPLAPPLSPPPLAPAFQAPQESKIADDTVKYRPTRQPPIALLKVVDSSDDTGELIRIRSLSFVIGRADGQLIIPHDDQISARHAEILRREESGKWA